MCQGGAEKAAHGVRLGRHAAEPTEPAADEAAGFWSEVARVSMAVAQRYQPAKMNWLHLGTGVPHLHVHLAPRPLDDTRAGGPLETEAFDASAVAPLADSDLEVAAADLRARVQR